MRVDIKGMIVANSVGWIYDFFGIECTTPKSVLQTIAKSEDETDDIYINSPGGDLNSGVEIYEELRQRGNIMIHVMQACSAASVIMCAGPSEISPAGLVMIHNVSAEFAGDHNDMKRAGEILHAVDKTVAGAYVAKTGKPLSEWLDKMNRETWMNAAEAVELGLIDRISGEAKEKTGVGGFIPAMAAASTGMLPQAVITKMMNEKAAMGARLRLLGLKNHNKEETTV